MKESIEQALQRSPVSLKVGIVNANPFSGNRGVGALAFSAAILVDRVGRSLSRSLHISFFGPSIPNRTFTLLADEREISLHCRQLDIRSWWSAVVRGARKGSALRDFLSCDLVLNVGEGDSFSDIYGEKRFRAIDSWNRVCRLIRKPYVFLPQTIGPFEDVGLEREAGRSLSSASAVFPRDRQSSVWAEKYVEPAHLRTSVDMAFQLPFYAEKRVGTCIHVGLSISSLLWHGGYTGGNQFGLRVDYPQLVKRLVEYFVSKPEVILHLVPHVVLDHGDVENDYQLSRKVLQELDHPSIVLAPFFLDPIEAKSYIAGLDFFAGSRMHATIAAFSSGVPVVPLGYSRKFNGLFEDSLGYRHVGDLLSQSEEEVMQLIDRSFTFRKELQLELQGAMSGIVAEHGKQLHQELVNIASALGRSDVQN